MRKIKFRGKRIDNNEWVYGYLYEDVTSRRHRSYIVKGGFLPAKSIKSGRFVTVDPKTVGQCIRVKDSSKKVEIYEGDIIKDDINDEVGVVEYDENYFYVLFGNVVDKEVEAFLNEVIGNIHDNPELLK